jgi:hypothetical protein
MTADSHPIHARFARDRRRAAIVAAMSNAPSPVRRTLVVVCFVVAVGTALFALGLILSVFQVPPLHGLDDASRKIILISAVAALAVMGAFARGRLIRAIAYACSLILVLCVGFGWILARAAPEPVVFVAWPLVGAVVGCAAAITAAVLAPDDACEEAEP